MTRPVVRIAAITAGSFGAVLAAQRLLRSDHDASTAESRSRWRAVTILKSPDEVMPGGARPGPLADLGDLVEVEVRPAPGDKGTELRARLRTPEPSGLGSVVARVTGADPRQQVRAALRASKQLIEVGELLRVDPKPHGHRPATPGGKLVDLATKRANAEGVL